MTNGSSLSGLLTSICHCSFVIGHLSFDGKSLRPEYHSIPRGAIKVPVPDTTQQTDYSCGASCLEAVCKYYGVGPNDEWEYVRDLRMDKRIGCHPHQIKRAAREYGLQFREHCPMTPTQIVMYLRRRRPVMLMIQAWGEREGRRGYPRSYTGVWKNGHWVLAIGYDRTGIYFEDPSLQAVRGYLSHAELETRWRDTGPYGKRLHQYGLAIWKPRWSGPSAYVARAEPIG